MKKQVSVILGICSNTDYLFCDETFDGLDPVMLPGSKEHFRSRDRRPEHDSCDRIPQPAGTGRYL